MKKYLARGFGLGFAIYLSACQPAGPVVDVAAQQAEIVDGTRESGRQAVVFLYNLSGAACTATIIAPRVVLTAYHCIQGGSENNFRVYVGSSTAQFTAELRVAALRPVPGAGFGRNDDVALLILTEDAPVTPMEISRLNPSVLFGQTATAIGYGQTPTGSSGTKYTTMMGVDGVMDGLIFVRPSVCSGDSGGPILGEDGLIYGVASFIYSPDGRTQPRCGTAPGAYNAIAHHMDHIDAVLEEGGLCVPDGPEICNGEDDDCNDEIDEGCIALGEPCTSGDECFGGLCADTAIGRVCTSTCDPLRPAQGCGLGFYCAASGCAGHCVPGEVGTLATGTSCSADTECSSLYCADPGDGNQRCLTPCRGDGGLCFAGEACAALPGACGGCVNSGILAAARGLGEPCEADAECREPLVCYDHGGVRECAGPCAGPDDCGDGFECRPMPEGGSLCIRDRRQGLGGACVTNLDCGETGVCATAGGRSWCTAQCTSDEDCPASFACTPAGAVSVCAPSAGLDGEECTGNSDCVSLLCASLPSGAQTCTSFCDSRSSCAPGFECTRTGAPGDEAVCIRPAPPTGGGCTAAPAGAPPSAPARSSLFLTALALLALAVRRR